MAAQPGLSARIDVDTRFITSPTALKLAVMVLGVACVVASIVALAVLDRRSGRRVPRRLAPVPVASASSTWLADIGVVGTLLLWHLIGATSSDDGYNLTIARVSGRRRLHRQLLPLLRRDARPRSTGTRPCWRTWRRSAPPGVWMRLPATAAAIGTWLILSRCVLPRLGRRLAVNRVAVWTAGAVFLAAWLPFNNGLRPEPLIAFGAVAVWVLVENAIGTRRLWPAAAGDRRRGVLRDARPAGPDRAGAAAGRRARDRPHHPAPPPRPTGCSRRWPRWPRRWR